jgi:nitroimidazol reductase NimA-like FMN-containing flavoprotein (pyridoxamine 5'-phosphate oxidase superfamily)
MTGAWLEPLSAEVCLSLLRARIVGRIAFVVEDDPVILPVNYRLIEPSSGPLISLLTRPGNVIEQAPTSVAFEIDDVDPVHHRGWSVLVRGEMVHATSTSVRFRELSDPETWLSDRDAWLVIDPWTISGRELHGADPIWPVRPGEYL